MTNTLPLPANEAGRIQKLADYDLDYTDLESHFKDLLTLAAKTAGTTISLVNLLDFYTVWTVSSHGIPAGHSARENSVCQYTVASDNGFEVKNLSEDDRFKDFEAVSGDPYLKYYYGVPIRTEEGYSIGALCVVDKQAKDLSPEKVELLRIIASEIVNRLNTLKEIGDLKGRITNAREIQKRVAHDIRGPIGGIIGLARMISEQGDENSMEEVLEFIRLIHKSGNSILELADEILSADITKKTYTEPGSNEFNQLVLKEKLEKLYMLQAKNKNVSFTVNTSSASEVIPFRKNKLLQIVGNIISNAIKFTPAGGNVDVTLDVKMSRGQYTLLVRVSDTGIGMSPEQINSILTGQSATTGGTEGEQGYGFGLGLVKHLVESLSGKLDIVSEPGKGTVFSILLPQGVRG